LNIIRGQANYLKRGVRGRQANYLRSIGKTIFLTKIMLDGHYKIDTIKKIQYNFINYLFTGRIS